MAAPSRRVMQKLIDIGANLTDPMYTGQYHGSRKHKEDLTEVLERSFRNNIDKIIITGGSLKDSSEALKLSRTNESLFCTVGCHPTRCQEIDASGDPDDYLRQLQKLAMSNKDKVKAIGECGLDYDRLEFCPQDTQIQYFERQIDLAEVTRLPMFLHCRNAAPDLLRILRRNRDRFTEGVVHSFDGSTQDAKEILNLGLYIGVNGCSLKTTENLTVVKDIPTERLMIETDAPWCEIRPTHASYKHVTTTFPAKKKEKFELGVMVKGRNEPSSLIQILEVLSAVKEETMDDLAEAIYENTQRVFFHT